MNVVANDIKFTFFKKKKEEQKDTSKCPSVYNSFWYLVEEKIK